jgi:hypothetical protein
MATAQPNREQIDRYLQRQYERGVREMRQAESVLQSVQEQFETSEPLKPIPYTPELLAILKRYAPTEAMMQAGTNPVYPNGCPVLPEGDDQLDG